MHPQLVVRSHRKPSFVPILLSLTICGALATLLANKIVLSATTSHHWAMLGRDAQHTNRSPFLGPQLFTAPTALAAATGFGITSSVVIDASGVVYVAAQGTNSGRLFALNGDGSVRAGWPFIGPDGATILGSPAIGPDSTIYAAFGRELYALNPDGTQKWSAPFAVSFQFFSSPVVAPDGTIVIGQTQEGALYAINPDGTTKWSKVNSGFDGGTPAIGADGTVYAGGGPGFGVTGGMTAINPDGTIKWASNFGGWSGVPVGFYTPVVAADGTIYAVKGTIGSINVTQTLLAIDPADGSIRHERVIQAVGSSFGSLVIAISPDGTVICSAPESPTSGYGFTGYSSDLSTVRFTQSFGNDLISPLTIGSDGTIYVSITHTDGTSTLQAFSLSGLLKSEYLLNAQRLSPAVIGFDGTLYLGVAFDDEDTGILYAFEGPSQPTPTPTPSPTPTSTPTPTPTPPTVTRTAPYDFFEGCNSTTELAGGGPFSQASAVVFSDPLRGITDVNVQAAGLSALAVGRAGVGINYRPAFTGTVKISTVIRLSRQSFDLVAITKLPKIDPLGSAFIESSAFLTASPPVDAISSSSIRSVLIAETATKIERYTTASLYNVEHIANVHAGQNLRICAGVRSRNGATAIPGLLALSKARYSGNVLLIRITPQ